MRTKSGTSKNIVPGIAALFLFYALRFYPRPSMFPARACTIILVGHEATAHSSLIIAPGNDNLDASDARNLFRCQWQNHLHSGSGTARIQPWGRCRILVEVARPISTNEVARLAAG